MTDMARSLENLMKRARAHLAKIAKGGEVVHQGVAFGDAKDDTEIRADRDLGRFFQESFKEPSWKAARISVEGLEDTHLGMIHAHRRQAASWYCVDPLDGSLNYKSRNGTFGLPFTACVTVLGKIEKATFADIQAACIGDLRCPDLWSSMHAVDHDDLFRAWQNGEPARTHEAIKLDLGSQIVIGEMYYPENREKLARAFAGKKGYLRSFGSAAFEMALVASGTAVAFICDRQKQHELGAGYALVKGSGGVAVDWDGGNLGPRAYDFKSQTPCVLAANQAIAEQVLELLHRT